MAHLPARELAGPPAGASLHTMHLDVLTPHTAPPASRPVLEALAADLGVLPNMAATIAVSPALLRGFDGLRRAVLSGDLDPVAREVAGLAVGVAVDNRYGVAFHSTALDRLGLDPDDLRELRAGRPPAHPKLAAVHHFARTIVLTRGRADAAAARAAGLTDGEMLEIIAECTFAGLVGVIDAFLGRVELDTFLRPQAWTG